MRTLTRALATTQVELFSTQDAQGKPTYASAVEVSARVKREDKVVRTVDGEEVLTTLTLWYPAGETPTPTRRSRVTVGGDAHIVVERREVRTLAGTLAHTRVRCTDE